MGAMRRLSALMTGGFVLVLATGCASGTSGTAGTPPVETTEPVVTQTADAAAEQQAQAWLDAAAVPPGAVRVSKSPSPFNSYQGWPCQPAVELEGYWTVPDSTVAAAANWLRENPTADLISTAVGGPMQEGSDVTGASIGYIPAEDSQEGIVYTVLQMGDEVAIRAEVAALTDSAVCPSLAPGEMMGKPGQG